MDFLFPLIVTLCGLVLLYALMVPLAVHSRKEREGREIQAQIKECGLQSFSLSDGDIVLMLPMSRERASRFFRTVSGDVKDERDSSGG